MVFFESTVYRSPPTEGDKAPKKKGNFTVWEEGSRRRASAPAAVPQEASQAESKDSARRASDPAPVTEYTRAHAPVTEPSFSDTAPVTELSFSESASLNSTPEAQREKGGYSFAEEQGNFTVWGEKQRNIPGASRRNSEPAVPSDASQEGNGASARRASDPNPVTDYTRAPTLGTEHTELSSSESESLSSTPGTPREKGGYSFAEEQGSFATGRKKYGGMSVRTFLDLPENKTQPSTEMKPTSSKSIEVSEDGQQFSKKGEEI
ncbi:MAG: hypothetical protein ACI9IL_000400 [Rickettsiales bacterium]|jgi:hypothetical protein